ncbi:MAG: hypothetical protein OEZ39_07900 [Gammaproteobacteria bacterium]|nr:hypothetical protein [Gammaproteobacteria bacterium]
MIRKNYGLIMMLITLFFVPTSTQAKTIDGKLSLLYAYSDGIYFQLKTNKCNKETVFRIKRKHDEFTEFKELLYLAAQTKAMVEVDFYDSDGCTKGHTVNLNDLNNLKVKF